MCTLKHQVIVTILTGILLVPIQGRPLGSPETTDATINVWELFAHSLNVSSFCLSQQHSVGQILSTCLLPVCHDPNSIESATWFYSTLGNNSQLRGQGYKGYHNWGSQTQLEPRVAITLHTPHSAVHNLTCARMTNCTASTCFQPSGTPLNCTGGFVNISYVYKYTHLPSGWFWTCAENTYNYIPAKIADGTFCCLSRLAVVLPNHPLYAQSTRTRRTTTVLDASCSDGIQLLSKAEYVSLAVSLIGVPGLATRNSNNINALACMVGKSLNATSTALAALNSEQQLIRHGLLQNRAAIDFLLLQHHYGCQTINEMCCFNLTDNSHTVQKQIQILKNLTTHIRIDDGLTGFWDFLTSWFPSMGWIKTLFIWIIGVSIIVCILPCIIPCALQCLQNTVQRMVQRHAKTQTMLLYTRLPQMSESCKN